MIKSILKRGITGILAGVALEYIAAIIVSFKLNLGYFMPCIATMPEIVGGEMKAVVVQAAVCACAGLGVAVASVLGGRREWKMPVRIGAAAAAVVAGAIPLGVLAVMIAQEYAF